MTQEGERAIMTTPSIFIHATQTSPPFNPCFSTSHDEDSDPIRPPTVNTAVTREYTPSVMPRQAGNIDVSSGDGVQVMDATGKLSSER